MQHYTGALLGLLFAFGGLSACGSRTVQPVTTDSRPISSTYTLPATYQEHRNQQKLFESSTGRIAYTDHGEGPVLLLLHGVPTSSWMYRKIIPELQTSIRVISVDHLGFGSSEKPEGEDIYDTHAHADRIKELLTSLAIDDYSILMHDMGGLVAWDLMRTDRQSISHLIVLNTIVNQEGFNHPDMNPGGFTRTLMNAYTSSLTSRAVLAKTFNDLGLTNEYKLTEEECYGYVAPMREGASPALYSFFTSINDTMFSALEENRTDFQDWQGEALVMWGAKDKTLTTGQIPILQTMLNIPDDNVHIYQDNAHFLAEEIPDEIVQKVTDLID